MPKSASLFTLTMWKMILGQAVYQLAVTFMLYFAGDRLLNAQLSATDPALRATQLSTVVFNTFVWMQIFNEFNNRRLDNRFNIFEGMQRNYFFLAINCIMVAGQVMIVFVGGAAFSVTRLNGTLWGVCLICAVGCLPWAIVLRTIPDRQFGFVFNGVVGGMAFVLRPVLKGVRAMNRGVKSVFSPVSRATRRLFSRGSKTDESSADPRVTDEESPASNEPEKLDRAGSPERPPATPHVAVPPITVTTSP